MNIYIWRAFLACFVFAFVLAWLASWNLVALWIDENTPYSRGLCACANDVATVITLLCYTIFDTYVIIFLLWIVVSLVFISVIPEKLSSFGHYRVGTHVKLDLLGSRIETRIDVAS